ncbi:arginyl-tRNA--protein transferase 1 isoform X1 [Diabrotica virgifera virgifera]|uniref:Arginyl-tRNA--protein transferase 1 n=1 Tax=Diabrotica virgifera virgifera TaxID=50390 RepID=A0ABM5JTW7_DIAVI|nr:arginyl-tRNA--protein transferase 1 isoform X1 [Diabrotica virgifera virgifera]
MNVDIDKSSVVQWFDGQEKHRCGYCKHSDTSITHGMWAESLTVDDYQNLIDRGWRRSGKYCYKSIMDQTCCPLYTIRCDVVNFNISKSQKKNIKKINKYLKDGIINKETTEAVDSIESESHLHIPKDHPAFDLTNINTNNVDNVLSGYSNDNQKPSTSKKEVHKKDKCERLERPIDQSCDTENTSSQKLITKTLCKEGLGADPNKPPCKKAKLLRIERKKAKGASVQKNSTPVQRKTLEEFLEEISVDNKNKLRMCLIPTSVPNASWTEVEDIEFELYKKYQMSIHNDPPSKLSLHGFKRFLVKSPLKITVERMSTTNDTFNFSANLYRKYQIKIHQDTPEECDEEQFFHFLVESPLQPKSFPNNEEGPGYGSFHQQYWLNEKLIAVGVIDILPKGVSSVYFFYDPDYACLTLGTYGSLREVELTRKIQKSLPEFSYYYMGFYIHSCPKMRYKGKLTPSYLGCPETYTWIPIEKCLNLLEANKYSRLNEDIDALDTNIPSEEDILHIKIIYKRTLLYFSDFKNFVEDPERFRKIGDLIGKKCCNTLIFYENSW